MKRYKHEKISLNYTCLSYLFAFHPHVFYVIIVFFFYKNSNSINYLQPNKKLKSHKALIQAVQAAFSWMKLLLLPFSAVRATMAMVPHPVLLSL
jgi:hypothetical protein